MTWWEWLLAALGIWLFISLLLAFFWMCAMSGIKDPWDG